MQVIDCHARDLQFSGGCHRGKGLDARGAWGVPLPRNTWTHTPGISGFGSSVVASSAWHQFITNTVANNKKKYGHKLATQRAVWPYIYHYIKRNYCNWWPYLYLAATQPRVHEERLRSSQQRFGVAKTGFEHVKCGFWKRFYEFGPKLGTPLREPIGGRRGCRFAATAPPADSGAVPNFEPNS